MNGYDRRQKAPSKVAHAENLLHEMKIVLETR